jgi:hypothetical protein
MGYIEKWKSEINSIRYKKAIGSLEPPPEIPPPKEIYSPEAWSFVSFVLPLVLIPLAIKGATMVAKEVKKAIDKKKS